MLGTRDVEEHDFAGVARVVEGNEETRAVLIDAEKSRPGRGIGDGERRKVINRGSGALSRIEQVQLVVGHARGKGALLAVTGNQSHVDGAGGTGRRNAAHDGTLGKIPHAHAAAQQNLISTGNI